MMGSSSGALRVPIRVHQRAWQLSCQARTFVTADPEIPRLSAGALQVGKGLADALPVVAVQGQALISLGALPPVISILWGLAFSAMGMRRVSTPAS
jgi:hypothetical protein